MKKLKALLLLPLFVVFAPSDSAAYYFGGLEDYVAGVPSQAQKPSFLEQFGGEIFYETMYAGSFGEMDPENRTMVLQSEVPGFLGPEGVSVPITVSGRATVDFCSQGECRRVGEEGWKSLASIPAEDLQGSRIIALGSPEDPARIITVIQE
ncbi:MAG: hypothetical protein K8I01_09705 [Candidatus Methylomirabilis sp.]|nr:hypothetical protein [Deltaproteobacteria bacterium]